MMKRRVSSWIGVLILLCSVPVMAQGSNPRMSNDGIQVPNGPSMLVGGRDSGTNVQGAVEMEDTTGVNALWATLTAASVVSATIVGPLGSRPAAQSVSTAPPTDARYQVSRDANVNAVGNPIWAQLSQDGVTAVGAANPLPISSDMAANAVNNTIFVELSTGTAAFLDSIAAPGYIRLQDGDGNTLADIISTFADALAPTLQGLMTGAVTYLYNGATLDMARSTASGAMAVEDTSTRAGEDPANGWRRVKKEAVGTYLPAKTATANVGTALVTVHASTYVLGYPTCTLFLRNTSANPFTDAEFFVSPDGAGTCGDVNWVSTLWVACDALATTRTCMYSFSQLAYPYICAQVAGADANRVTVDAWLACQVN